MKTPVSFRTHISIFGNTNAGKSSLFNALLGQNISIVSNVSGTTADPVTKAMELLPYGPVAITDTAGLCDNTALGKMRTEKTKKILHQTDFAIYAADSANFDKSAYEAMETEFKNFNIRHMLVFTKSDLTDRSFKEEYPDSVSVSVNDKKTIDTLRHELISRLNSSEHGSDTMIGDLLPSGSLIIHVIPIDSLAPKGRLILPQVQLIRDCLDHGMESVVVRDTELAEAIAKFGDRASLVVTDSQAFAFADKTVPKSIPLTSYSILMARMKSDIAPLIDGAYAIDKLQDGDRILMAEACTHNASHEDIGRVKIPALLTQKTGKQFDFDFCVYRDFPESLSDYSLIIHCGGCMINSRTMLNRIRFAREAGVPITNYGVCIAYLNGILDRAKEILG